MKLNWEFWRVGWEVQTKNPFVGKGYGHFLEPQNKARETLCEGNALVISSIVQIYSPCPMNLSLKGSDSAGM